MTNMFIKRTPLRAGTIRERKHCLSLRIWGSYTLLAGHLMEAAPPSWANQRECSHWLQSQALGTPEEMKGEFHLVWFLYG